MAVAKYQVRVYTGSPELIPPPPPSQTPKTDRPLQKKYDKRRDELRLLKKHYVYMFLSA